MPLLPGVKPWVQAASDEVAERFRPSAIYGVSLRPDNPSSDHPKGLAADYMVGKDRAKGDAIATYLVANASRLSITYVIWYDRIWTPGKGWGAYVHPSGGMTPTQRHRDHVHGSFSAAGVAGAGTPTEVQGFGGIPGTEALQTVYSFVTDTHNYIRAAMLIGGIVLLIIGLLTLEKVQSVAKGVQRAIA